MEYKVKNLNRSENREVKLNVAAQSRPLPGKRPLWEKQPPEQRPPPQQEYEVSRWNLLLNVLNVFSVRELNEFREERGAHHVQYKERRNHPFSF